MVVSHRESSISSNIRAIIEQLNLNPVERRRLIDKTRQESNTRCKSFPDGIMTVESQTPKISIGVYGCKDRSTEFRVPDCPITMRKIETERSRSRVDTRQKLPMQKKEAPSVCQVKIKAPSTQVEREAKMERVTTNEGKFEGRPIVTIGSFKKNTTFIKDDSRTRSTTMPVSTKILPTGQRIIKREHTTRIGSCTIEDKIADPSGVSIRPLCKIEDCVRSKKPDTATNVRIPRPSKEHMISKEQTRTEDMIERSTKDTVDRTVLVAKEDLPQLESVSLNHTAAHHRISVRPKNRRPPRRTVPTTTSSDVGFSNTSSIPPTIVEDTLDSLEQQKQEQQKQEQQLSQSTTSNGSLSPTEPPSKTVGVIRKSSSRLSRNSDIFEELESRLPRKTSATSLSPDSLDVTTMSQSSAEIAATEEQQQPEIKWITRKPSNRISKGSDVFEELEAKLPRRRSTSNRLSKSPDSLDSAPGCWFSKSTDEAFDKLVEYDEIAKPVASVRRPLLNPISKSTDRVSKSSDSLEAIEPLVSDDSIERRRSFDFRVHKSSKLISKSSENFDVLEQSTCIEAEIGQKLQKRSSVSDINLSRRRLSKSISKSSDSFERIDMSDMKDDVDVEVLLEDDAPKAGGRRTKRMSSESSDNLDGEDRLENRRVRRTPKRMPSTSIVDMIISGDDHERERRPTPTRKPSRLQKSSESSELGSTDTLDSERRNKSSESTETLDSLEKDLEQDGKDEEITDSVDKREKNDSWSSRNAAVTDSDQASMGDDTEDSKSLISADNKYYWRQSSEPASKENLGIQQLLAITIMTRMADNGNNQRGSYPKKRQQMSTSQPSSPVAKQEDTKMLFDNLLVNSKNDEDLQNMLNGNISEVSTDTKSFKEKLIMFEKLGK